MYSCCPCYCDIPHIFRGNSRHRPVMSCVFPRRVLYTAQDSAAHNLSPIYKTNEWNRRYRIIFNPMYYLFTKSIICTTLEMHNSVCPVHRVCVTSCTPLPPSIRNILLHFAFINRLFSFLIHWQLYHFSPSIHIYQFTQSSLQLRIVQYVMTLWSVASSCLRRRRNWPSITYRYL